MNDETLIELIKILMNDNGVTYQLKQNLYKAMDKGACLLSWCVDDMICLAEEYEERMDEGEIYDRSKMDDALSAAIDNHDCNLGISWDVLGHYLDEYCLLEEK